MDRETVNALISELSARGGLDRQAEYVMHLAVGQGKYWILDKYLERLASQAGSTTSP
ncbi:hypothetical protein [Thermogymnomonas acidicola]|uniref:hypothetical protein n=1 Tax=Thermogymnomonas acidicola TaxID=399579 RepID=UPI001495010A|nr:hypothetical protein [Thermogymnomonas acidicola]